LLNTLNLLSQCSEDTLWIESCKDEFGHICQGQHGTDMPTGMNTIMFFIPVTNIPKGKKPTYLCIIIASHPEN
jgi:hypothetical protein